jgi:hypothetical protein
MPGVSLIRFKAAVETQIWITILVALMLRNDLTTEIIKEKHYDIIYVVFFIINVPVAFAYTLVVKLKHAHRLLAQRVKTSSESVTRQQAWALHTAGLANEEETQVLREYISSLHRLNLSSLAFQIEGRGGGDTVTLDSGLNSVEDSVVPFCWTVTEDEERSLALAVAVGVRCQHTTTTHEHANLSTQAEPAPEASPEPESAPVPTVTGAQTDYYDKYSTGFVGAFGGAEVFFGGLTGLIGDCHRDVLATVTAEHCSVPSGFGASDVTFQTSNYKVNTTPRKEWLFVYSPELLPEALSAGISQSTGQRLGVRDKQSWQWYIQHAPRLISAKFKEAGYEVSVSLDEFNSLQVRKEEIIGLRLYTGPVSFLPLLFVSLYFVSVSADQ